MDMKANKLYFIIGLLLLQGQFAYSQKISIELSAKWVKGYDVFEKNSTIYYPELIITYRNNSDSNLYFSRVSNSRCGLPNLPYGTLFQYPIEEYLNPNYLKRAKNHGNYSNNNYTVEISNSAHLFKGWYVYNDTVDFSISHAIDFVNDELADIYEYMYIENCRENNDSSNMLKTHYSASEITPENILHRFKDLFVFLKPGEIYQDNYNLIAFKLLKGNFTFCVEPFLPDYIYAELFNKIKTPLPKVVGEYNLYSGNVNSNKITIAF